MTTYEKEMQNPEFRELFEKERSALEISEFLAEQMAKQGFSVRKLAEKSGVSATVIQDIKSGRRKNIEYATLKPLIRTLGFRIEFKKERVRESMS